MITAPKTLKHRIRQKPATLPCTSGYPSYSSHQSHSVNCGLLTLDLFEFKISLKFRHPIPTYSSLCQPILAIFDPLVFFRLISKLLFWAVMTKLARAFPGWQFGAADVKRNRVPHGLGLTTREVIDTEDKLTGFLPKLRAADWVSLDTEADSLHAYPEKICLIQISITGQDELIDPLAGMSLTPLLDALNAHELIMHGADYDLRLLEKHHEFIPSAIFDTMLAARLLGERHFGLSALVEKFLGIKLDKGSQKANWAQRPLTERMEKYARADTFHLKPLVDRLRSELDAKQRLAWHQESCARLIEYCTKPQVVDLDLMWRVKGSSRLSRASLAVLREIWRWREREAVRANRPPFFILNHEKLVDIAVGAAGKHPVENLLPPQMSPRRKTGLQEAIQTGLAVPEEAQPEIVRHHFQRPSETEFQRYRELEKIRDARAHELGIDASLIASRPVLGDLARDWEQSAPSLMNWQRELLQKK
jgi:ribonuclease D